jgi:ATP-binding cassette subfamily F protein 3
MKEYQAQQEYIARTEEFIRRYKAGQRSKEAQGREKRLNRYKEQQALDKPNQPAKQIRLNLDSQLRSGELVLALRQMAVGYGKHVLMQTGEHEIHRGERVALLGPNGSGKTTLLRTLLGQMPPIKGTFSLGHHVAISYYAQGHDALRLDATVLDEILRVNPNLGTERARTLLGSFLFHGDDVFKRVGDLSGGERSRVAIAGLTLLPGNLLVLDEPTNHLDINARESLETTLRDYPGAMLFVSHDRQFIDALADKLWVIEEGRLTQHLGNYTDYAAKLAAQRSAASTSTPAASSNGRPARPPANNARPAQEDRQRKKRIAALEAQVETLEQELGRIRAALEEASAAQDVERITALGSEYNDVEARLDQCYTDWAELAA